MIRVVAENLALLLAPTLVYLAYVMLVRKDTDSVSEALEQAPLVALFVIGSVLAVGTMAWFGSKHDSAPNLGYEPPSIKNGQIEPGRNK